MRDGCVSELATEVMDLAGDSIDNDVARAVHQLIMEERHESLSFDSMSATDKDTLLTKCEIAKRQFERLAEAGIVLASYGGKPAIRSLTRSWFESIIATYVEMAIELLAKAIESAGLHPDAVNRLLVIGGSAKLRLLHERLRNDPRFAASFYAATDAEWDVALGAAYLQQSEGGYEASDSLGIVLSDNDYYEIVRPGSRMKEINHSLTVSLIEDAPQANIMLARRNSKQQRPENVLSFGVDTLGFDLEPITLKYWIDADLVFKIQAESNAVGPQSRTVHDYGRLRFSYHL
jgi:molecular chaperone DnaK